MIQNNVNEQKKIMRDRAIKQRKVRELIRKRNIARMNRMKTERLRHMRAMREYYDQALPMYYPTVPMYARYYPTYGAYRNVAQPAYMKGLYRSYLRYQPYRAMSMRYPLGNDYYAY